MHYIRLCAILCSEKRGWHKAWLFIKILTKTYKGEKRYYASLVENKRINGKVVQTVKANLGPVTEEQIPYLKAAYAAKKPRLVYDDD